MIYKILIFCAGLLLADALFIAATSLWVGFVHRDRDAYWVPLFAGALMALAAVWLFIRFLRTILKAMNRSDILRS